MVSDRQPVSDDPMSSQPDSLVSFSDLIRFADVAWNNVPDAPGVYVIYDLAEVLYVGMAGRDGGGSLRKRLRDHSSGQVVNMFAQYLFLARVQFVPGERITHPRTAKAACRAYILERCSLRYRVMPNAVEARTLENALKRQLKPALNAMDE
jgi:excinuclease UvrABC nuclease subunit